MEIFRHGEPLTRRGLNSILPTAMRSITAGPGIRILPTADGICIASDGNMRGRQGGGVGGGGGGGILQCILDEITDGNALSVFLYAGSDTYSETTTSVLKPPYLRYSFWGGNTITYTDGREISYNTTSLDAKYQRRATWDTETEIQEITSPYAVGEMLLLCTDQDGNLVDMNVSGRHWARALDQD